ncbi:MAG: hypothetical protein D6681_05070 [Calditrichaeota bacterium]|nr:MAG: hypothetical protein D6681_05070 [Calditrichota bacterium]
MGEKNNFDEAPGCVPGAGDQMSLKWEEVLHSFHKLLLISEKNLAESLPVEQGDNGGSAVNAPDSPEFSKDMLLSHLADLVKSATLGQIAAAVIHEINNPLQIILGKIQVARFSGKADTALDSIERETMRIGNLTREFLSFARRSPDEGGELFSPNDVIERVLLLIRRRLEKRGIELSIELDQDVPFILGNSYYLQQFLISYLLTVPNRVSQGGRVSLVSHTDEEWIVIEIRDNGIRPFALSDAPEPSSSVHFRDVLTGGGAQHINLLILIYLMRKSGMEIKLSVEEETNQVSIKIPVVSPELGEEVN